MSTKKGAAIVIAALAIFTSSPSKAGLVDDVTKLVDGVVDAATQLILNLINPYRDQATFTTCDQVQIDGVWVHYCMQNGPNLDHNRVIWFFHGHDGNERTFGESPEYTLMRQYWAQVSPGQAPVFISASFGDTWFLNNRSTYVSAKPALRTFFHDRVMPTLEGIAGVASGAARYGMGESMGGYNLGNLLTHYPGLFSRAVMGCAALFPIVPWSDAGAVNDYALANPGAIPMVVQQGLDLFKADYADESTTAWNEADPLQHSVDRTKTTKLLLWWNVLDQYGFKQGDKQFAVDNGATQKWNTLRHCQMTPDIAVSIAKLLE